MPSAHRSDIFFRRPKLNRELLMHDLRSHIQPCHQHLRYTDAASQSILFHVVIQFSVKLADMRTRIWFFIVRILPPKVLLVTTFNSRHVKSIDPKAGFVRIINYHLAPISETWNETVASISIHQPPELISHIDSSLDSKTTTSTLLEPEQSHELYNALYP